MVLKCLAMYTEIKKCIMLNIKSTIVNSYPNSKNKT